MQDATKGSLALLTALAQKAADLGNTWYPYAFDNYTRDGFIRCKGLCCPQKTRGKYKGEPNFRKGDPLTRKTVFVDVRQIHAAIEKGKDNGKA